MTDEKDKLNAGKVTLDIELKDLLNIVSSSGKPALSENSHTWDSEDLKKAWFNHMLVSMEKLNDLIENIRRNDLVNLRKELRDEIKRVEAKIDKVEDSLTSHRETSDKRHIKKEEDLNSYKKDVIKPLQDKVLTLTVKWGVWAALAGFVGSGIMVLVVWFVQEYIIKSTSAGSP